MHPNSLTTKMFNNKSKHMLSISGYSDNNMQAVIYACRQYNISVIKGLSADYRLCTKAKCLESHCIPKLKEGNCTVKPSEKNQHQIWHKRTLETNQYLEINKMPMYFSGTPRLTLSSLCPLFFFMVTLTSPCLKCTVSGNWGRIQTIRACHMQCVT